MFAPGSIVPFKTLTEPPATTTGIYQHIAIDGHGSVYVTYPTQLGAEILVYPAGATSPSTVLSDPSLRFIYSICADGIGNVVVTYQSAYTGKSQIGAFAAFTSLGMSLGIPFFHQINVDAIAGSIPYAAAFDRNGNLLVSDNNNKPQLIGIYPPAVQTAVKSLTVGDPAHYVGFNQFALSQGNHHLLVAPLFSGFLYKYAYPSGALQWKLALPVAEAEGIATSPASPLGSW